MFWTAVMSVPSPYNLSISNYGFMCVQIVRTYTIESHWWVMGSPGPQQQSQVSSIFRMEALPILIPLIKDIQT